MAHFVIGAFLAGCGCGLVPMILGIRRGHERLGAVAFLSCLGASLALGIILAIPVSVIFVIVIIRRTNNAQK